ncbi:MAG: Thiamine pyrophosphokinase [Firmicutes bacterium ADurb.Bin193]|nr:MAG: Thiamine pyrophosphokinase [Firmicutes bacterium ADurb.Bin193]
MRAWVFGAASDKAEDIIFCKRIKFNENDLIICADGGYDKAALIGITPDIVIGDMDSLKGKIPDGVKRIVHPSAKDKTDMDLCIDYALESGCNEIILLCAFGGRIDHSIASLISLRRITESGAEGMLLTARSKVFLIKEKTRIKKEGYSKLSIIPVTDIARGVTTEGLWYPLENAELKQTDNLGISNAFSANEAVVDVKDGILCIICETD